MSENSEDYEQIDYLDEEIPCEFCQSHRRHVQIFGGGFFAVFCYDCKGLLTVGKTEGNFKKLNELVLKESRHGPRAVPRHGE